MKINTIALSAFLSIVASMTLFANQAEPPAPELSTGTAIKWT